MKIAIAGYGVEGIANYDYWSADASSDITIVDERTELADAPSGVKTLLGPGVFSRLDDFDIVVRTASLAPTKITTSGKIWSATNEFFAKCPAPIVGVTGTKGKGTTASILASLFKASGRKTWLVGNIGLAAISVLNEIQPEDIVVFELSSFQLWDIEASPQAAIVLLIEPDHLNVHADMEDYVHAKGGITRYQKAGDICVYHPTNADTLRVASEGAASSKIRYAIADDGGAYVADGSFKIGDEIISPTEALHLKGDHNKDNACAAITVARHFGVTNAAIEQGLRDFEGLPHRLEYVRTLDDVDYYNDSFSSAPAATVAAIRSFDTPERVIVGGIDKGADFTELTRELAAHKNVVEVVLIGEVRQTLHDAFTAGGVGAKLTVLDAKTMPEIVSYVHDQAEPGDTVILSPACASFDMFKDFYDRGEQFKAEVSAL